MITEKDIQMFAEAKNCNDCPNWHKYCKAECCKSIFLHIDPDKINKTIGEYVIINLGKMLNPSDQHYYKLHDVRYARGTLRFKKDRLHIIGRKVFYFHKCELLDENNLCKGHPDKKPAMCRELTLETAKGDVKEYLVTDNCLFKYKQKGGSNDGE